MIVSMVPSAAASTVVYTDQANFVAATGASLDVDYPTTKALSTTAYTEDGFTIEQANGETNGVDDYTPVLPDGSSGNELVLSGPEHVDITLPGARWAFGMYLQDGYEIGFNTHSDPCPRSDSVFHFSFYAGATLVYEITVDPPVDQAYFLGVATNDASFDRVTIREVGAALDENAGPHCENDFFGYIYTATAPLPPVPELGSLALAGVGLVGLAGVALVRRRSA